MIKIFVTGGTFDKDYDEKNGRLYFKKTHMNEILALGRSKVEVGIETLMMLDSLDMKEKDRELIVKKCTAAIEDQIVITHGTDTMVDTAKYVANEINDKVIIFTGAMIPIKFGSSDGLFNLGSALSFAQILKPGVYITMNGQYFNYDNVIKNKQLGIFEKINK